MFEIDGIITMSYSQYSVFPCFKCYLPIQHNTFFNCDHVLFLRGCCSVFFSPAEMPVIEKQMALFEINSLPSQE